MASCIGLLPAPACLKAPIAAQTKCLIGTILTGTDHPSAMTHVVGEPNRFIVAFCGSGTGHLTQAMRVVEMLQERGQILAGVVTDTDASEKMLDEMVRPLGVELLVIPAIELVDTDKGFTPLVQPHRFFGSFLNAQKALHERRAAYAAFFSRARAGRVYSMWHITLARFFQLNPLPPSITCVHSTRPPADSPPPWPRLGRAAAPFGCAAALTVPRSTIDGAVAAQFGLCELTHDETVTFIEVSTKAVVDFMRDIFVHSGEVAPISPLGMPGSLPPIIHAPAPIELGTPKLVLCYFLVSTNVERLDAILAADPMPGVEFHCFTSRPLDKPNSQLHSHMKQRKLFQELFAKCTAVRSQPYSLACSAHTPTHAHSSSRVSAQVIVSAGNETVWEAVCRGVPVLTIPTEGHGEQMLNASVHARNFPSLVRQRPELDVRDVRWLVNYNLQDAAAVGESTGLRRLVDDFNREGSPLLRVADDPAASYRTALKKRVSGLLDSARALVGGTE